MQTVWEDPESLTRASCPALAQNRYLLIKVQCCHLGNYCSSRWSETWDWQSQYPGDICVWIQSLCRMYHCLLNKITCRRTEPDQSKREEGHCSRNDPLKDGQLHLERWRKTKEYGPLKWILKKKTMSRIPRKAAQHHNQRSGWIVLWSGLFKEGIVWW